jgi:hypothetical protein
MACPANKPATVPPSITTPKQPSAAAFLFLTQLLFKLLLLLLRYSCSAVAAAPAGNASTACPAIKPATAPPSFTTPKQRSAAALLFLTQLLFMLLLRCSCSAVAEAPAGNALMACLASKQATVHPSTATPKPKSAAALLALQQLPADSA